MIVALYILASLVAVGSLLWAIDRFTSRRRENQPDVIQDEAPAPEADEECCGMHITCERDSLLAAVSDEIVYFDDEELDAYAGRPADSYTLDEQEQFRDILLTLLPDDIAPWARSLQLRGIELPSDVRDELLMVVAEARQERAKSHNNG